MVMQLDYYPARKREVQGQCIQQLHENQLFDYGVCNPASPEGVTYCVDPYLKRAKAQIICEIDPSRLKALTKYLNQPKYKDNNVRVATGKYTNLITAATEVANSPVVKGQSLFIDFDLEPIITKLWEKFSNPIADVFSSPAAKLALRITSSQRGITKDNCMRCYEKILYMAAMANWDVSSDRIIKYWNDNGSMFGTQTIFTKPS